MPTNIEIKARVSDLSRKRQLVRRLTKKRPIVLRQVDTFFNCKMGRLKLRRLSGNKAELIFYARQDKVGTKESRYVIYNSKSPSALCSVLAAACGATQIVRKRRLLYIVGQTKIHLDSVVGLGSFIEVEVVLKTRQQIVDGHRIARRFMNDLEVNDSDLVGCSYADLLAHDP